MDKNLHNNEVLNNFDCTLRQIRSSSDIEKMYYTTVIVSVDEAKVIGQALFNLDDVSMDIITSDGIKHKLKFEVENPINDKLWS